MKPSSSISVDFSASGSSVRPGKPARSDSREEPGLSGFSSRLESAVHSENKTATKRQKIESSDAQPAKASDNTAQTHKAKDSQRQENADKVTASKTSEAPDDPAQTAENVKPESEGTEESIRAEAEALLDRLNASSQQLQMAKDGKELPPEAESSETEGVEMGLLSPGFSVQSGVQTLAQTGDLSEGGGDDDSVTAGQSGKLAEMLAAVTKGTASDAKGKGDKPDLTLVAGSVQSAIQGDAKAGSEGDTQPDWLSDAIARLSASAKGGEAGLAEGANANQAGAGQSGVSASLQAALADAGLQMDTAQKEAMATGAASGTNAITGQPTSLAAMQRAEAQAQPTALPLQKEMAGEQLAERVQMLMSKNLKHVDIRLDPPELGRMQIKLAINNDQASVQFHVGNAQTRDLVEQAMPRLRELLQQQGIQLTQGSVQQDGNQQFAGQHTGTQQGEEGLARGGQSGQSQQDDDDGNAIAVTVSEPSDGIDYYA
ncbi:flagellar hook-length control protein FliK [Photobacterium sp. 2_MG-2023]|uniref:flagellar hook-length control protein FliK n=1 Tax=Photobacterium sp. 2_MG-2023 TaxID=3062663 RepID=UPI0026E282F0|nr:flagellar hook-length control protein FliK [Photobacterium sp. 2_MG-2023]MDO6581665.1 flagellar hook-length control protein FliK [Photobacterium sp. 2_MG-2023]